MSRYEVGDSATLSTVITVDGAPVDSTDLALVITRPDGTTITFELADLIHTGTGAYRAVVGLDQLNTWRYVWTSSDPMVAESGTFDVRPPAVLLAQIEDVEDETGTQYLTTVQRNKVRARLISVSADVIGETGQKFYRAERTTSTVGDVDSVILLPQRPVVSVASVSVDGVTLVAGTDYRVVGDRLERAWGRPWGFPGMWTTVEITYTAGYDVIPDDIVSLCARRVATQLETPNGVRQYSIGSFSATVSNETLSADWSAQERRVLARYSRKRRPGIVRVI